MKPSLPGAMAIGRNEPMSTAELVHVLLNQAHARHRKPGRLGVPPFDRDDPGLHLRCVLVRGVTIITNEGELARSFARFGEISSEAIEPLQGAAIVVFAQDTSVKRALEQPSKRVGVGTGDCEEVTRSVLEESVKMAKAEKAESAGALSRAEKAAVAEAVKDVMTSRPPGMTWSPMLLGRVVVETANILLRELGIVVAESTEASRPQEPKKISTAMGTNSTKSQATHSKKSHAASTRRLVAHLVAEAGKKSPVNYDDPELHRRCVLLRGVNPTIGDADLINALKYFGAVEAVHVQTEWRDQPGIVIFKTAAAASAALAEPAREHPNKVYRDREPVTEKVELKASEPVTRA